MSQCQASVGKVTFEWTTCLIGSFLFFLLITVDAVNGTPLQYRIDYRRSYLVMLGDTINLTCPYDTPFYKWTPAAQTSWILSEDQVYSLKADNLAASGKYICSAVNGFGHNSAEFSIKVIDKFSPTLEQSCVLLHSGHISESGPCFLNTYTEPELSLTKVWGEDVTLDCDSIADESLTERVTYKWEFYRHTQPSKDKFENSIGDGVDFLIPQPVASNDGIVQRSLRMAGISGAAQSAGAAMSGKEKTALEDSVAHFSGSILTFKKVTLSHSGEYRCTVHMKPPITRSGANSSPADLLNTGTMSRSFRLLVQSRSEGAIIQGPHNVSATVDIGQDATFSCETSKEEHRSATIRWGKYISLDESEATEFQSNEVLHWSGGTYVVLPTILPQNLHKFLDSPKPLAVSSPGSRQSRLVLRMRSSRDAGLYVCSVITESGRDDHKFVHISLKGDVNDIMNPEVTTSHRLTIYIAVPIGIFLICICAVTSLIIRNRSRNNRRRTATQRNHKLFLNQNKSTELNSSDRYLDHSSVANSTSMTFRQGGSPLGRLLCSENNKKKNNNHMQLRNSPLSTANSSSQHVPSSISPSQVHPVQYIYPSPVPEYAYFKPDGAAHCPIGYAPIAYPPTGTYMNGVDYQHFSPGLMQHPGLPVPPSCNGISPGKCKGVGQHPTTFPNSSGESSACTDLGFDGSSAPFSVGHYSLTPQEPDGRVLCVSPSSGP